MKELLEKISENRQGKYVIDKSSWFNGKVFFPMYSHLLEYEYKGWSFSISYVFKQADFSTPTAMYYESHDLHFVSISITTRLKEIPNFSISSRTILKRIFKISPDYKVTCKDNVFKLKLEDSKELYDLFNLVENGASDFSPVIEGKKNEKTKKYLITIGFNSIPVPSLEFEKTLKVAEFLVQ